MQTASAEITFQCADFQKWLPMAASKIVSQNTASAAIIKGEGRFFSMAKGQDRKKETKKPKKDKAK
jgi:hypothetical protein